MGFSKNEFPQSFDRLSNDLRPILEGDIMPRCARSESVDPLSPQFVHVWNRCVRRAFLCGRDRYSGKSFEHRRIWARKRIEHLASCFGIDVITFAIMSNHTHQVLKTRPDVVDTWDDRTVAVRWLSIDPKKRNGKPVQPTEAGINTILSDSKRVALLRRRLSDVSWWMRCFAQHISWRANREDDVTGHFWESRFCHEVITDQASLLACMIYVDLNPTRAGMANTLEESDFTGIKQRIDDLRIHLGKSHFEPGKLRGNFSDLHAWEHLDKVANEYSGWLSPLEIDEVNDPLGADAEPNGRRCSRKGILAMSVLRYIDLVEWCGREIRSDKRGSIPSDLSPILGRLGLDGQTLIGAVLKSGNGVQTAEGLFAVSTSDFAAPAT